MLLDFQARYEQPNAIPTAVVRIAAKLVANPGRRIVANLTAEQQIRAAQNSVDAVVQAFDSAFGAALTQIVNWTLDAPPPKTD